MTDSDYGYCNSTSALLTGLSEGGRHGFDAPYVPRGKFNSLSRSLTISDHPSQASITGVSLFRKCVQYSIDLMVLCSLVTRTLQ